MELKYFDEYGLLAWLAPEKYWSDGWTFVEKYGTYEDSFDIVLNASKTEYRYTNI